MTRTPIRSLIAAASFALAAFPALAADFQIFTAPNFSGAEIQLRGETPDVAGLGNFHDQAASLVVNDRWEVCTEANYRGDCVVVGPGRYPTLSAPIRGRIGSIRPLGVKQAEERRQNYAAAPPAPREDVRREELRREELRREELRREQLRRDELRRDDLRREEIRRDELRRDELRREEVRRDELRREELRRAERERARFVRGSLDLFPRTEYRGRAFRVDRDEPTVDEFIDEISSLVIYEGVWQLCPEPGYRGRCSTLEPGRYPTLRGGVASLRQVR